MDSMKDIYIALVKGAHGVTFATFFKFVDFLPGVGLEAEDLAGVLRYKIRTSCHKNAVFSQGAHCMKSPFTQHLWHLSNLISLQSWLEIYEYFGVLAL